MNQPAHENSDRGFYLRQNKVIHHARNQLCMDLDDCRELARQISGKASISSLSLALRWKLIETLKAKGANVKNPHLSKAHVPPELKAKRSNARGNAAASTKKIGLEETEKGPVDVYWSRLAYWEKRFPKRRPGFPNNKQLAWIEALWILDFSDGRPGKGLRGFIYRQTGGVEQGPVSDLAFLRNHHVDAVLLPLKRRAKERLKKKGGKG